MPKLTALGIKSIVKPGRYGDGDGLYLKIAKGGSKSWVQRIVVNKRRRDIGLGGYPTVTIAKARLKAAEIRAAVADGRDPMAERQRAKVPTFREAAIEFHSFNLPLWRSAHHAKTWLGMLERHVFPRIGNMLVDEIKTEDIVDVLEPIWTELPETARRVRQRVRAVFRRCMSKGYVEHNPAGESIDGAFLPVPRSRNHLRSLPYQDCPAALDAIEESEASLASKLCLKLIILTATRYGEARYATWSEIDWDEKVWTIPAFRMKMNRPHRVPLSDAAVVVLKRANEIKDGSGLIFPSPLKPGKAISENTLTKLLKRIKLHDRATVHGFRSSFRMWAAERTSASHAAMEISLAHAVGPSVEQAYMRSDLLGQRRELMQQWADYLAMPSD